MMVAETGLRAALGAVAIVTAVAVPGAARAQPVPTLGHLVRISQLSPFAGCTEDHTSTQTGVVYPNSEIEPWVDVNPTNPDNLVAVWQQDRWSDGGSRGLVAGVSRNGGTTWSSTVPNGQVNCAGGPYLRASDPWVTFAPNGWAFFNQLVFQADLPTGGFGPNGMTVSRSKNGGLSWQPPIALRRDVKPQVLNDKNSITADPTDVRYVYAVWDRLIDYTLTGEVGVEEPDARAAGGKSGAPVLPDGVLLLKKRIQAFRAPKQAAAAQAAAQAATQAAVVPLAVGIEFRGPTWFARTTDSGDSWERAHPIYDPGGNAQTIGNQIVVLPDGTLLDFFTQFDQTTGVTLRFIRSTDKGASWSTPTLVDDRNDELSAVTPDAQEEIRDADILFDVAVDPRNGHLYAVYQAGRFSGFSQIAFSQSVDRGATWSKAIRINLTPPNTVNVLREQALIPSIAVAGDGTLVVTYYDFRNDLGGPSEKTDYFAEFCSGACTDITHWGREQRLTTFSFDYLDAPTAPDAHFLGDYMALTTSGQDIYPVFGIATRPNATDVYLRKITLPASTAAVAPGSSAVAR